MPTRNDRTELSQPEFSTLSDLSEVLIVANPSAGRGAIAPLVQQLRGALQNEGLIPYVSNSLDNLRALFEERFSLGNLRAVVPVGGDGTIAAVANITEGMVPIVVVPMGTENLLARRLGLSKSVPQIVSCIREGRVMRIDAGRVNNRLFLIMFSCGFDADVVRRLHESRKGPISLWSYARPLFNSLRHYHFPPIAARYHADGQQIVELNGHWLFAFNFNCYARGLPIAPLASATDGLFEVCSLRSPSRMSSFFHFLTVVTKCQGAWSGFEQVRCATLRVESPGRVPYQVDGDMAGYLPADIDILPQRIPVVLPVGRQTA